jgi:flagellar basal-body rod modification protein FlgD
MTTVNATGSTTNSTVQSVTTNNSEMGKDQFLKLLVTQLKYQDPMNPMEDKEFISQMAQFSTLEQMKNMNTVMENMSAITLTGQAAQMIGKEIEWQGQDGKTLEGKVTAVKVADGQLQLIVGEDTVGMYEVTKIKEGD